MVDYRQTFLRRHLQEELRRARDPGSEWEVEALLSFKGWLGDCPAAQPDLTLDWFLYGECNHRAPPGVDAPVPPALYVDVPVETWEGDASTRGKASSWTDLSSLLAEPASKGRGVLLLAPSGGGKTVALRKAFFDTLRRAGDPGPRPLPYWLQLDPDLSLEQWEQLFLSAIRPEARQCSKADFARIKDWLRYGPPVILFCDLDDLTDRQRRDLARCLATLHKSELWQQHGHRCVVARRLTDAADDHGTRLLMNSQFDRYRLLDLKVGGAETYIEKVAAWFCRMCGRDKSASPLQHLPQRLQEYRALIGQLERTPWRIHAIALAVLQEAPPPQSFERLLDEYYVCYPLAYEMRRRPEAFMKAGIGNIKEARRLSVGASTRLSLLILHDPDSRGGVAGTRLETLCKDPALALHQIAPQSHFWVGKASIYYSNCKGEQVVEGETLFDALHSSPWLHGFTRKEAPWYRLVPEELIPFFAGVIALRYWQDPYIPDTPIPAGHEWYTCVLERLSERTDWEKAAESLGGFLDTDELEELIRVWISSESPRFGVGYALLRNRGELNCQRGNLNPLPELLGAMWSALSEAAHDPARRQIHPRTLCEEYIGSHRARLLDQFLQFAGLNPSPASKEE